MYAKDAAAHLHCPDCTDVVTVDAERVGTPDAVAVTMQQHARLCRNRIVTCDCGESMRAAEAELHRETCPRVLITCKFCKVKFKRGTIEQHEVRARARVHAPHAARWCRA
ncbi:MAG: hypothetical protein EOO41_05305 [Methanobacteriota archaeon]|nr:MAG: hypothetical protein EOO41_05305 [Euryarchaeota archaeon]